VALTDAATIKSWANPALDSSRDTELTRCAGIASEWVKAAARRVIEETVFTRYFSGFDAFGSPQFEMLLLEASHRPLIYPGTGGGAFSVKEDGITLTHAQGYNANVDVIVENANTDHRAALTRRGGWSRDISNIEVIYTAGYATASVPSRVKHLATEVAWLIFQSPGWLGKATIGTGAGSVTFEKELTPQSREVLDELRADTL